MLLSLLAAITIVQCDALLPPPPAFLNSVPIWSHLNLTTQFALFRSPEFKLRSQSAPLSAQLYFAAEGSPRPPEGTTQAKLLGAAVIYVNGVLVAAGPGHNVPTDTQVVRQADVLPYLRADGEVNTIGIASFFASPLAPLSVLPRVQAALVVTDDQGEYAITDAATSKSWQAWGADSYFNPTGDAGISWYPFPNEYLNRSAYPLGWNAPGYSNSGGDFVPAVPQPEWPFPLYFEPGPVPVALRRTVCRVLVPAHTPIANGVPFRQILDYGQEFMGGVNLTFAASARGARVNVVLAEELLPDGSGVLSPMRTRNNWNSTWTLSGNAALDAGVVHHEFVQFRYAQVDGSPVPLTTDNAFAWVIQHPAGGDGRNPYEEACAASTPAASMWGAGGVPTQPLPTLATSDAALNTVWRFCAYTIIATSLDVNVDGQTRERDVDVVDALNTALGQFYVFAPDDTSVARRTLGEVFTNDTGAWTQWYDFHASSVLLAQAHALHTADGLAWAGTFWAASDTAILADHSNGSYNSLQFLSGLRYFNTSGLGLLHFSSDGSCGGSWACNPLVDWPQSTRDGYDCSPDNSDDTVRSAFGAMAFDALGGMGVWLNKSAATVHAYASAATAVREALLNRNLRENATMAYFVDGAVGNASQHAAIHSTVYAVAAGTAEPGGAPLAAKLTKFMTAHGVAPSSCMMGRWWVEAYYNLGVFVPEAADAALAVLTSPVYPSWLDMLAQGASTTMEAWRPADKSNLDWAHPWCASPSFTIPSRLLGVQPIAPGWSQWRAWPQPSNITSINATVPTPAGLLLLQWSATTDACMLQLTVLPAQAAFVCLPPPAAVLSPARGGDVDARAAFLVDGQRVQSYAMGRLQCATQPLPPGSHTVTWASM